MTESASDNSPSTYSQVSFDKKAVTLLPALVGVIAIIAFGLTCFRTINWWENSEYSLVATTLGVSHPPGALLPTLLGWIVVHLPVGGTQIFKLNLFAAAAAAITSLLVCSLSIILTGSTLSRKSLEFEEGGQWLIFGAIALTTLTFAFSETLWSYALEFTPYIFTALFTALILWGLFKWWGHADDVDAFKWLFLVAFLFGLDFSVHRTNLLMFPGAVAWIFLRHPRTFLSAKSWRYSVLGLVVGLGIHFLIIPLAARSPLINFNDPSNWSRFWDYTTIKQYGGGWLINLFPRKAPFWQVQLPDYFRMFADNFAATKGKFGVFGLLPLFFGAIGLTFLIRRNWRIATGLIILFLFASIGGVLYFNTPANYFRSMDRHYLPSFVIFAVLMSYGAGAIILSAWNSSKSYRPILLGVAFLLLIIAPIRQFSAKLKFMDKSNNYFAHDFAYNSLCSLPQNAILFTGGDNDTYPLWYLQMAEGFRSDVTVLNIHLLNTSWYVGQIMARDLTLPLLLSTRELSDLTVKPWHDTTISVPVRGIAADYQLPVDKALPDTIHLNVPPTVADKYLLVRDQIMLQIIARNDWRRPICCMATMDPSATSYLNSYLRIEGLSQRLVPISSPPLNRELLRKNFFEQYLYRGYADSAVPLDETSRTMGWNYYYCMMRLSVAELESGSDLACREVTKKMLELLPPARLQPPPEMQQEFDSLCTRVEHLP